MSNYIYTPYVSPASELCHYGIKGQKWGVRRYQNEDGTYTEEGKKRRSLSGMISDASQRHKAKKDAKEYARAQMYYGEGAGNRRKLIKETVKERSKNEIYKEAFEKALTEQDMASHAQAARGERAMADASNEAKRIIKKAPAAIATVAGAAAFYVANKSTIDPMLRKLGINV